MRERALASFGPDALSRASVAIVPHLAVGLVSVTGGAVPPLLAALDVRPAVLRAAVARTGEPGGA